VRPKGTLVSLFAAALLWALTTPADVAADHANTHKIAGGLSVHLGVVPAAMAAPAHPADISWRRDDQHVMVAVFEAATGSRVQDAKVEAHVAPLALAGETRPLNPRVFADALTYCNRFTMSDEGIYRIAISVSRPGTARPVQMTFVHHHEYR
jgi:hypothetical protein